MIAGHDSLDQTRVRGRVRQSVDRRERMGYDAALDRAQGALIGLALGDALGHEADMWEP